MRGSSLAKTWRISQRSDWVGGHIAQRSMAGWMGFQILVSFGGLGDSEEHGLAEVGAEDLQADGEVFPII